MHVYCAQSVAIRWALTFVIKFRFPLMCRCGVAKRARAVLLDILLSRVSAPPTIENTLWGGITYEQSRALNI